MGYIQHKALVVTGSDYDKNQLTSCHEFAKQQYKDTECPNMVTPILEGVNAYLSFAVLPDGSKEGWSASNESDECIEAIMAKVDSYQYEDGSSPVNYVYVQLFDDDGDVKLF